MRLGTRALRGRERAVRTGPGPDRGASPAPHGGCREPARAGRPTLAAAGTGRFAPDGAPVGTGVPGQRRQPSRGSGSPCFARVSAEFVEQASNARRRPGDPGRPRAGAPVEWRSPNALAGAAEQPHAGFRRARVRSSSSGSSAWANSAPTKPAPCSSRCPRRIRSMPRPADSCRACAAKSRGVLSAADSQQPPVTGSSRPLMTADCPAEVPIWKYSVRL